MRARGLAVGLLIGLMPVSASSAEEERGSSSTTTEPAAPTSQPAEAVDAGLQKSAEELHQEGVRLLQMHQLDGAVQLLRQAVALDDTSALYVTDLGYAYLKQRHLIEAETAFKKGIELDPTRPHAYEHLEQSITQQPERWEKRQELFRILEQGLLASKQPDLRLRIEVARLRAERSFGLIERARGHIEQLLHQPKVPRAIEKQLVELRTSIEQDKKALALRDWPEPAIDKRSEERLASCERVLDPKGRKATLATLNELLTQYPAWRAPRALLAKLLSEQGHYDEAVKELTILTRLVPSAPTYHRQLGIVLAEHGGWLELERADDALRTALALEPEWQELEAIRERLAARRYDTFAPRPRAGRAASSPSENAIRLFNEAEASLGADPASHATARALVDQALRESPTYVEAAALSFSLSQRVPEATINALWSDPDGIYALYQEFSRLESPPTRPNIETWLDRAIQLGNVEARLTRALNKKGRGDVAGAEVDLSSYLALLTNPEEIEAVQRLRAELNLKRQKQDLGRDAVLAARLRLQKGDAEGALRVLEAPCRPTMSTDRLLALGIVYERMGKAGDALECYEQKLQNPGDPSGNLEIARREARLLARGELKLLDHPAAARLAELVKSEPSAFWAMARRAQARGLTDEAEASATRYLAAASPDDRFVADAKALKQQFAKAAEAYQERERRLRRWVAMGVTSAAAFLLALVYLVLFRGSTITRAIRRRPGIFPELSRIVGELRHDVLKHRTSALELVNRDQTTLEKLRRTILEPIPTSTVVVEAYQRCENVAASAGIRLRRLRREPVFGAFYRDLRRVERALGGSGDKRTILAVDGRLRGVHLKRLNHLMTLGPNCTLDAAEIQRWIAAIQTECGSSSVSWTVPALQMSEPELRFPVEKTVLFQIFSNLLRNAEAAVAGATDPRILVGLLRATDFAGKPQAAIRVSDNAQGEVTDEMISNQPSDRGLGIVREAVRDWHGRLVVSAESAPYCKSLTVEFAQ